MNKRLIKIVITSAFAVSSLFAIAAQTSSVFAMNEGSRDRAISASVDTRLQVDASGNRSRRVGGELEPMDDKGGLTPHVEPGDDKGGLTPHAEPGDDKGGGSGKSGHN
jgi:hypothetical protein